MRNTFLDIPFIEFILIIDVEAAETVRLIVHKPTFNDAVFADFNPSALSLPVTFSNLTNVNDWVNQAKSVNREYQRCTLDFEFLVSYRDRAFPVIELSILNSLQGLEIKLIRMLLVSEDLLRHLVIKLLVPVSLDEPSSHLQVLIL